MREWAEILLDLVCAKNELPLPPARDEWRRFESSSGCGLGSERSNRFVHVQTVPLGHSLRSIPLP